LLLPWHALQDERWWFQVNCLLGEAGQGGGEAHELLRVFADMRPGRREDWHEGFRALASATAAAGKKALAGCWRAQRTGRLKGGDGKG